MNTYIEGLIDEAKRQELITSRDVVYCRNRLFELLGVTWADVSRTDGTIPELLNHITEEAVRQNLIEDFLETKEILVAKVMDVFLPKPSDLEYVFQLKYFDEPKKATGYFYHLSQASNYIQTARIAKNISYQVATSYGELDITINMSKPEKDPAEIARQKLLQPTAGAGDYPKCLLCVENEGYAGRLDHPARTNHRVVPIRLGGQPWYFQYSPYVYYNEHCILLSEEHRDMVIDEGAFERLLDFVDKFPHYFAGSNADLPIVGGSILSHDHYQGGRYDFAMARAEELFSLELKAFPSIEATYLKWPLSVIRLRGMEKEQLIEAATLVLAHWRVYSDEVLDILAVTDQPHNTITPIARRRGDAFELDLVLRNNRTTEEHPMGLFHPHEDVHHIKRENIGLIEVMGLAVLPARLKAELREVIHYVEGRPATIELMHQAWADSLKQIATHDVETLVYEQVGQKFLKGLEDCGVYKQDEIGYDGVKRFIDSMHTQGGLQDAASVRAFEQ
ncbi:UDP-glucose--hexose-1-phosphate uridylyltransferase [Exiguobacterium mexicanum]|uniref:UDP-glucose--hexose-1-phosphate uridylyltransferase n=1 Tax=Exiguobacterium mexicanum TaxID=340146 RepID=UPI00110F65E5|nr:UDP-glucose--hexose-1-phosphate uridylyltransferase [Exiguobacterium mexicanum]